MVCTQIWKCQVSGSQQSEFAVLMKCEKCVSNCTLRIQYSGWEDSYHKE